MSEPLTRDQRYLMRFYLARADMSVSVLAGLMGVHANTVRNWTRGDTRPHDDHKRGIVSYLRMTDAEMGELLMSALRVAP